MKEEEEKCFFAPPFFLRFLPPRGLHHRRTKKKSPNFLCPPYLLPLPPPSRRYCYTKWEKTSIFPKKIRRRRNTTTYCIQGVPLLPRKISSSLCFYPKIFLFRENQSEIREISSHRERQSFSSDYGFFP